MAAALSLHKLGVHTVRECNIENIHAMLILYSTANCFESYSANITDFKLKFYEAAFFGQ